MEHSPHLLVAALEAAANAVVMTDAEGRITWVNPAFTQLTGYLPEEALGQTTRLLKSGEQDPAYYQHLWQTITAGRVWHGTLTNRRKDGSLYVEEQMITPVRDEAGVVTHFIAIKQDVTGRTRIEALLRRQVDELASLHAMAVAGAGARDVGELLQLALKYISGRLHPGGECGVGLVDESAQNLRLYRYHQGRQDEHALPLGRGILGQVIHSGQPVLIPDTSQDADYVALGEAMRSELCVPLLSGERVIGVINVESPAPASFGAADQQWLTTLAGQLAVSVERVRLYQDLVRAASRRSVLYQAVRQIGASLEPEQAYAAIHRAVAQIMSDDSLRIALLDEARLEVHEVYHVQRGRRLPPVRVPKEHGISGYVIATGNSVRLDDTSYGMSEDAGAEAGRPLRALLAVPLRLKGEVNGVLVVQSGAANAYDAEDQATLELLAFQMAGAIENARLFAEVQQLTTTDPLTGLNNRRQFFTQAERELERARRYKLPLSALMVDVDHFRRINESHTHAVGDEVLRAVAQRCRACLREIDLIGRHGGEEFAAFLPLTDAHHAWLGAERLRRAVAERPIETERGALEVTISIGVAELDPDCRDVDMLLDRADQALSAAKRAGRNQAQTYRPAGAAAPDHPDGG